MSSPTILVYAVLLFSYVQSYCLCSPTVLGDSIAEPSAA